MDDTQSQPYHLRIYMNLHDIWMSSTTALSVLGQVLLTLPGAIGCVTY